ncbi:MAG: OmpH family outer membrane protein [candidate division NC10 bacterium]|nr:OmpH family outer membrane protein [candidate division NC10 bacterium]
MKRWIFKVGLLAAGVALCMVTLSEAKAVADSPRLATVDVQRLLLESKAGKQAKEKVEAERNLKQKEITAREEEINKLQRELEKQASILSEAARKEKQDGIDRKMRDLRRTYDDFSRDLQKKEGELVRDLLKEVGGIIRDYAKEKGYTLILEKGQAGILYSADEIDLTKEIIGLYDAKTK